MSWVRVLHQSEAVERRQHRAAQKHQKELERRAKESAKFSELERVRLEVDAYENELEILLSIHKEQGEVWDWKALAASLPPPCPRRLSTHELQARQTAIVAPPQLKDSSLKAVDDARAQDEQELEEAVRTYDARLVEHVHTVRLAHRIVSGDMEAYGEAIGQLNPFTEIFQLGSSVHFTIHTPKLIECNMMVNAFHVIPAETKSLTAAGKLTVKAMPRAHFHEVYQDYVCGCVLRVAREVFALLPVEVVLVTATVDGINSATGQSEESPVLSVAIPQAALAQLDFDRLDPSDTVESFLHRGDFKATRKTEAFFPIVPLTLADVLVETDKKRPVAALFAQVRQLRTEIQAHAQTWSPAPPAHEGMSS